MDQILNVWNDSIQKKQNELLSFLFSGAGHELCNWKGWDPTTPGFKSRPRPGFKSRRVDWSTVTMRVQIPVCNMERFKTKETKRIVVLLIFRSRARTVQLEMEETSDPTTPGFKSRPRPGFKSRRVDWSTVTIRVQIPVWDWIGLDRKWPCAYKWRHYQWSGTVFGLRRKG